MLFLPAIIVAVFARRTWLRTIAGIVWFIGLVINPVEWVQYLMATLTIGGNLFSYTLCNA